MRCSHLFLALDCEDPLDLSAVNLYLCVVQAIVGMESRQSQTSLRTALIEYVDLEDILKKARESPDETGDPSLYRVLLPALFRIWVRVLNDNDTNIMSRVEFSLFTFFQDLFVGNQEAISARKRHWDHTTARENVSE